MPDAFVALDLETTGLSVESDRIMEVGAVRFDRSGSAETFETFVDPGQPIPPEIQELTGISERDVSGAPRFHLIADDLRAFIGDRAIVGQNIAFDIAFLAVEGIVPRGQAFDTWEIASVLLPTANRLNLASLAGELGIAMPVTHRALADAEAAKDIFLALLDRLDAMPRSLLLELRAFAERSNWAATTLIDGALERTGVVDEEAARRVLASLPVRTPRLARAPLEPRETIEQVTEADVEALFRAAADRTDLFPAYERRAGQEQMAHAVARQLARGGHLAVEAGTGTGKSLAYLLPALLHALRNDDRVVVSTHTLNLQDQLATKDAPIAAALVEAHTGSAAGALRTTVLKGRANYLCLERWAQVRLDPSPSTEAETRLFARISAWLPSTETGDLAELYMTSQERPAWDQVSAADTDCLQRRCPYVRDGSCFVLRARQRAGAAHAVIVNHSLLLANAARDDQVLPPFRHVVIDEAHRLEDVATQHYGATLSIRELRELIEELGTGERHGQAGLVRQLQSPALAGPAGRGVQALAPTAGLGELAERLAHTVGEARDRVRDLADAFRSFIDEHAQQEGRDGQRRREISLTTARRAQPAWEDCEEAALQADLALHVAGDRLLELRGALAVLGDADEPHSEVEALRVEVVRYLERCGASRDVLRRGVLRPTADDIAWLYAGEGDVRLQLAPLDVADHLASDLYAGRESVAVTSATLTTAGTFAYSVRRLGLEEPETLEIPSPYDYRRAVLAVIAQDMPDPGMPAYDRTLHETLAEAAIAAGGRTLALFTSHQAVRAAAAALRERLAEHDIIVLAQGVDGSPLRLLRLLMERPRALLIGTAAFWEGVDVQGEALSQIVMARLPFPVPSDPLYEGRAQQYDDPFEEYALPQAVLRYRQGFGRLIRGAQDRGVFVVLDSRIARRAYGEVFLDALPDCEVRRLRADDVPATVAGWLG